MKFFAQALLRPGRLDRKLYVSLPSVETRKAIFDLQFKRMPIAEDVDILKLVEATGSYSGAEVSISLLRIHEHYIFSYISWNMPFQIL